MKNYYILSAGILFGIAAQNYINKKNIQSIGVENNQKLKDLIKKSEKEIYYSLISGSILGAIALFGFQKNK